MNEQEQVEITEMQHEYENAIQQRDKQIAQQSSAFSRDEDDNLVKWQLELDNIMERIDHLLRGHKFMTVGGESKWMPPEKESDGLFNDYGVNEILRILSLYLNRNTILSNYDEDMIELKVLDFGMEVNDLILNKYEAMGLNVYDKMVLYPMIVRELIDVVHSSYLRALNGGERESLREARTVNQSIPMGGGGGGMMVQQQRSERGLLNPLRYTIGKYK